MASRACARSPELSSLIVSHLAPEPSSLIVSNLAPEPLAAYATVSEEWRWAVERRTFSTLHLNPSRLADFARIVTSPRRQLVGRLEFDVVLDAYSKEACSKYETPEEQAKNDKVFTEAVKALFSYLSAWSEEEVSKNGLELNILAYSPSDLFCTPTEERMNRIMMRYAQPADLLSERFERSYLRLVSTGASASETLPDLPIITRLHVGSRFFSGSPGPRLIWPGSASAIALKLPRLQDLKLTLGDNEKRNLSLRKTARDEFRHGISSLPSTIKSFSLYYPYITPRNESFMPPDITPKGSGSDPLSNSLRTFSQQLTSIYIEHIVISSEFFWPLGSDAAPIDPPHWPYLTTLNILFLPVTPSGQWLFERDPAEEVIDDEEDRTRDLSLHYEPERLPPREDWYIDHFRRKPNERLMNDFYLAIGRAVDNMPCLRELVLRAEQGCGVDHTFEFVATETTASLTMSSATPFELEEMVLDVWREAARKNTGAELETEFLLDPFYRNI